MKPQKEITSSIALLFLAQNLFFPLGVQAQTPAASSSTASQIVGAVGGIVGQIPAMYNGQSAIAPNFSSGSAGIQTQLAACLANSALGLTGDTKADQKTAETSLERYSKMFSKKGSAKSTAADSSKPDDTNCSKPCGDAPDVEENPSCGGNLTMGSGGSVTVSSKADGSGFPGAKKQVSDYVSCLVGHQKCGSTDPNSLALKQQLAAFSCYKVALQSSVQQANQALQSSLQANQKTFADMNQYQKEVGQQAQQVLDILGPDPELGKSGASQMQGLLGMQKELNDNMPKMVEADAKFKTDIAKLKSDTTTNEQNLEASRVSVASQCIKGSRSIGGSSLTCFKPQTVTAKDGTVTNATDRNGNVKYTKQSCGPYDYIRSKIEQKAYITDRGIMMTQDRRDQAQANSTAFDSLADAINRAMGDYTAAGSDGARLDTDIHTWSDVEAKVSANIDAVAGASGLDVRSMLRSVAGQCFNDSNAWKNQQIRSSSSTYSKKKTELSAAQTALTSQMNTGISMMSKSYSDVMAVLGGQAVTLDRSQCTQNNPDLMENCYAQIRQKVQDLLEGNGGLTATAKTITGGTPPNSPVPFVVSCRGLNGCVTAFKNVRDQQKSYIADIQKKKEAFVNQSNQMTQMQMSSLAMQVSNMQSSMLKQFEQIKSTLGNMKLDVPNLKFMDPEALEASSPTPPDNTPGPFKNPRNMSAALSQFIQPGGMVNLNDDGTNEIQKQISEKNDKDDRKTAENLKTYRAIEARYAKVGDCSSSVNNVQSDDIDCGNFQTQLNSCNSTLTAGNSLSSVVNSLYTIADQIQNGGSGKLSITMDQRQKLNAIDQCKPIFSSIRNCQQLSTKNLNATTDSGNSSDNTAGRASGVTPTPTP